MNKWNCPLCAKRVDSLTLCSSCRGFFEKKIYPMYHSPHIDTFLISFEYGGPGKELIYKYKFQSETYLAEILGDLLCKTLLDSELLREHYVLTYVPMTKRAREKRGFNQSKLLCQYVSQFLDVPMVDCFEKRNATKEQVGLSKEERLKNVKGAFAMKEYAEQLIIVDDVITTGATVGELARIAKEQGIKKVAALVAATQNPN